MIKAELRRIFLAKRREIAPDERRRASLAIAENFFAGFDLSSVRNLHSFIPIEKFNEVDTMLIIRRVWTDFPSVRTFAPRVDSETGAMHSLAFSSETELVRSRWGVHEPGHDEFAAASEIDLVIAPGLVFDSGMHRVGYGKGFYDRFLSECRPDCLKIGVNFFEPVDAIDDVHAGDVRMNRCVTPAGIFGE